LKQSAFHLLMGLAYVYRQKAKQKRKMKRCSGEGRSDLIRRQEEIDNEEKDGEWEERIQKNRPIVQRPTGSDLLATRRNKMVSLAPVSSNLRH